MPSSCECLDRIRAERRFDWTSTLLAARGTSGWNKNKFAQRRVSAIAVSLCISECMGYLN
eukprot:5741910-Amphidinium_carterae.2